MKSVPPKCEKIRKDRKIVLEENKSKITFLNPNGVKILVIQVDGCVIDDNQTARCDYALVPKKELEIYVELKGRDINHAVQQLESTITFLSENPQSIKKLCFIVSSRVPKQTTTIQQIQSRFKKQFNAVFRVKNIQETFDLSTLYISDRIP
ncbi:MAG: hypothetical protein VKJ64_10385 [Leptolyngbyaceae bacterium]|nr:hypothetical protein [Leptolyngbyaceae bacterium]